MNNQKQEEAICHFKGPCMVVAPPGSGKTYVITKRIQNLITKYHVSPENILVITFTKAAALEMKERFLQAMEGAYGPVTFGTFHAVFFQILKHAYHYSREDILAEDEKSQIFRELIQFHDFEGEDAEEWAQKFMAEISCFKNSGKTQEEYKAVSMEKQLFDEIYDKYEKRLRAMRKLDFDDMLLHCQELFTKRKDILSLWQNKFSFILIDEFQDINPVQFQVISMLAKPEDNLFIVGDDDQSIYGFRGSSPEIMLSFPKYYKNVKQISLEYNYRSQSCIVEGALKVIVHNKNRFPKNFQAVKEKGREIEIQEFEDRLEEHEELANMIENYKKEGGKYSDIAVLFRTLMTSGQLCERLAERRIPFLMKEKVSNIYEHFVAKDIFAYMTLGAGSKERKDLLRVLNKPKRYISRSILDGPYFDLEDLKKYYEEKEYVMERFDKLAYDLDMIGKMPPFAAVNYIGKGVEYENYLKEYAFSRNQKPDAFLEVFQEIKERAKAFPTWEQWKRGILQYGESLKRQREKKENKAEAVVFLTMHGSKGLEFPFVILPDANEGITPHKKAKMPEEMEEERRMFYVAMTRAKERLYIAYIKEKNGPLHQASRFVKELEEREEK